eukprot:5115942-Pleurochrysis_carterae.AAC.2
MCPSTLAQSCACDRQGRCKGEARACDADWQVRVKARRTASSSTGYGRCDTSAMERGQPAQPITRQFATACGL